MFRVDRAFRSVVPPALEDAECAGHFHLVQIVGNQPIWFVVALSPPDDAGQRWWRKLLFDHVSRVLDLVGETAWIVHDLYVVVPAHLSPSGEIRICRCRAVAECFEPDGSERCWRIDTVDFAFLDSAFDTPLGDERSNRTVWSHR